MTDNLERWTRSPDVAFVDDGERIILLRLDALPNQPRLLHGSAGAVWRMMRRPCSAAEIAGELPRDGATGPLAVEELQAFLEDLTSHGLVRRQGGVSP